MSKAFSQGDNSRRCLGVSAAITQRESQQRRVDIAVAGRVRCRRQRSISSAFCDRQEVWLVMRGVRRPCIRIGEQDKQKSEVDEE